MKYLNFKMTIVAVMILQLTCCTVNPSKYTLKLPAAPEPWVLLLGEPHWRVEWLSPEGKKQSRDIPPGKTLEIEIPSTWTNPVTAYPWWPKHRLTPGLFKPAGALFPHDVSGGHLRLTWKAGVDAVFYRELAYANEENIKKIPSNFDWIRFRELFNEPDALRETVRNDPWLVDWRNAAEKTISGNFDRRRLVPQAAKSVNIPILSEICAGKPASLWYGTSPFAEPVVFNEGEPFIFQIHSGLNAWISSEGILRCDGEVWFFTPWE